MTAVAVSASPMLTMGSSSQTNGRESQWFDSKRFLDPAFNAEQYVADLRRYVSSGPEDLHTYSKGLTSDMELY